MVFFRCGGCETLNSMRFIPNAIDELSEPDPYRAKCWGCGEVETGVFQLGCVHDGPVRPIYSLGWRGPQCDTCIYKPYLFGSGFQCVTCQHSFLNFHMKVDDQCTYCYFSLFYEDDRAQQLEPKKNVNPGRRVKPREPSVVKKNVNPVHRVKIREARECFLVRTFDPPAIYFNKFDFSGDFERVAGVGCVARAKHKAPDALIVIDEGFQISFQRPAGYRMDSVAPRRSATPWISTRPRRLEEVDVNDMELESPWA